MYPERIATSEDGMDQDMVGILGRPQEQVLGGA